MSARPEVFTGEIEQSVALQLNEPRPTAVTQRLLTLAVENRMDAGQLRELVQMDREMRQEQAALDYAAALAAFQDECPPLHKSKNVSFVTKSGNAVDYDYAPLDEIVKIIRPVLRKHGLSFKWDATTTGGMLTCICTVWHVNGHRETSSFTLPTENASTMSAQQKVRAANTFAQRTSLEAALGLVATGDNDAVSREVDPTPITATQVTILEDGIEEVGVNRAKFLKWLGVEKLSELRDTDYDKAINAIEAKRGKS